LKKLKIVIASRSTIFHQGSGGMETHLTNLAEGLVKSGHEVRVVTTSHPEGGKKLVEKGVIYFFLFGTQEGKYSEGYFRESANFIHKLVETTECEIVLGESIGASGFAKMNNRTVPVIEIAHGSLRSEVLTVFGNSTSLKALISFGLKTLPYAGLNFINDLVVTHKDDMIICVSEKVAVEVTRDSWLNKSKVRVVHNGVDEQKFKKSGSERERLRKKLNLTDENVLLGSLGRLIQAKGYQDVIKVLPILPKNVHYLLVGEGDYQETLKEMVKEYGLHDRVHFAGALNYDETPNYYSAMDVFMFPTRRREGFPMTLVEAQMCSLPVIAADKGGVSEAIDRNITGLIYPSGNLNELKRSIQKMLENQAMNEMADKAAQWGRENFTTDIMVEKTLKVISEAIENYEIK